MGYLTSGNEIVDAMGSINISGNIIPAVWYRTITKENGKPYLLAIVILADIVYWYCPSEVRDQGNGYILGWKKKFSDDLLRQSYQYYADLFRESKKTVKTAMDKLEKLQVIRREFRTVSYGDRLVCNNVMYVELKPDTGLSQNRDTYSYTSTNISDRESNHINQSESEAGEMIDRMDDVKVYIEIIKENIEYDYYMKYGDWGDLETVRCFFTISEDELGKCQYNYKGKDTYAFVMSDRYIMALYTYCLSARKAVALENIEPEGLSEAELSMVKLERVWEVLF